MEATSSSGARPRITTLLAILGLAAALRLVAWWRAVMMMDDGGDFLWQAGRFLDGDAAAALSHPYHPGYAALTAIASLATGDLVIGGLAVSVLGGLLCVLASWGIARCALPDVPSAPAAAALAAATFARLLDVSSDIQSDGIFLGFCMTALWATVAAVERGGCRKRLAAAGLFTGLAYLTRPEGLYLAAPVAVWVGAAVLRPSQLSSRLGRAIPFAVTLALLVAPYVLALHSITGVWGLSLKPSLQVAGLREGGELHGAPPGSPLSYMFIPFSEAWHQERLQALDDPPAAQARTPQPEGEAPAEALQKGTVFCAPLAAWVLAMTHDPRLLPEIGQAAVESVGQLFATGRVELWVLVIPGFIMLFRLRRDLAAGLALVVLGWLAVSTLQLRVNGYLGHRHVLMVLSMLLPVAGLGFVTLWSRGRVLKLAAVLAIVAGAEAGTHARRPDNGPRLAALAWITEHTGPDQRFLTHRRRDGYYAQRIAIPTRMPCDEGHLVRRIARDAIPYLVYDLHKIEDNHPDWLQRGVVHEVARFEGEGDTVLVLEPRFDQPPR